MWSLAWLSVVVNVRHTYSYATAFITQRHKIDKFHVALGSTASYPSEPALMLTLLLGGSSRYGGSTSMDERILKLVKDGKLKNDH